METLVMALYVVGIIVSAGVIADKLPESFGNIQGEALLWVLFYSALFPLTWAFVVILKLFGRTATQTLVRMCR